ncbi:unnamed protein product [Protopolystoma xenopodis]|uniref:Uncharacterized protein n=1 Tax=Protopolystoma xenopodis TaxID=117903 RepID=A0A448WY68_9PLAT|nr:unnamed protein product [Protopolystoma xenopodis]
MSSVFSALPCSFLLFEAVYYRRGILKKNGVLGVASVPLGELANSATIEQAFDLVEGRKAVGGRIEIRLRHREPLEASPLNEISSFLSLSNLPFASSCKLLSSYHDEVSFPGCV